MVGLSLLQSNNYLIRITTRVPHRSPTATNLTTPFYRIAFRRKIYDSIAALQTDQDAWLDQYNHEREHQGRWCYGKTPMRTCLDSLELAMEKLIPH